MPPYGDDPIFGVNAALDNNGTIQIGDPVYALLKWQKLKAQNKWLRNDSGEAIPLNNPVEINTSVEYICQNRNQMN